MRFSLFCILIFIIEESLSYKIDSNNDYFFDVTLPSGKIRVRTPANNNQESCTVIMMGIGTDMDVSNYNNISMAITNLNQFIVVITDHNPDGMVKTDAKLFRNLTLDVKKNLLEWIHDRIPTFNCSYVDKWLIGGHSASGEAAHQAINEDLSLADAEFSLDPFDCSGNFVNDIPSLFWGFSETTCFVFVNEAGKACYLNTNEKYRVFYRINVTFEWEKCVVPLYLPNYFHCSFTDTGCIFCSDCHDVPASLFIDVAKSVGKFVNALNTKDWRKSNFEIEDAGTPMTLFVNSDTPQ